MGSDEDAWSALFDAGVAIGAVGGIELIAAAYEGEGGDFVDVIKDFEVEIAWYALKKALVVGLGWRDKYMVGSEWWRGLAYKDGRNPDLLYSEGTIRIDWEVVSLYHTLSRDMSQV